MIYLLFRMLTSFTTVLINEIYYLKFQMKLNSIKTTIHFIFAWGTIDLARKQKPSEFLKTVTRNGDFSTTNRGILLIFLLCNFRQFEPPTSPPTSRLQQSVMKSNYAYVVSIPALVHANYDSTDRLYSLNSIVQAENRTN